MVVQVASSRAPAALLEALPDLVARTTHDLNNHLALILGKAELALMTGDVERHREGLEQVLGYGQEATRLIASLQRIIAWSAPQREPVPVGDVLSLVSRIARRQCEQRGVSLVIERESSGRVESPLAAMLAVTLWRLIDQALDGAGPQSREQWSLSGGMGRRAGVCLETGRPLWDLETRAAVARSMRTGEDLPGDAGALVRVLRSVGADLEIEGNTVRILVS
jgi:hypothetical protein